MRRLHAVVGAPGIMIGVFSIVSFLFGVYLFVGQYNRPKQTGRTALARLLAQWVRRPDYLGLTLVDYASRWQNAPPANRSDDLATLQLALNQLGSDFDRQAESLPMVHLISMKVVVGPTEAIARWSSPLRVVEAGPSLDERLPLSEATATSPAVTLGLTYRLVPALAEELNDLESAYNRLLLGLLGLSGFSFLCLLYMILNARLLADRVAREAAQEATIDLADRTCHELGNGVFVLANERRNLAEHLALVERFIAESPTAREAAAARAGLEPELYLRWEKALRREYADRGLDPEHELRGSAEVARHVCHQIDVCSTYISSTVRELDGFLKHRALPVSLGRVELSDCFDEALALMRPRLDALGMVVERRIEPVDLTVWADRQLLIHALVNLIKNAIEAGESADGQPRLQLEADLHGRIARIRVSDNGPGVPPELAQRIFEPGTTTKGQGRGRGLAIVRESIQLQGGTIRLERLGDRGSRFWVELATPPSSSRVSLRGTTPTLNATPDR
ncbi:MAG: ATP-binding protein [Isosphaeraceae bacterium]